MAVPMLDLSAQNEAIRDEARAAIDRLIDSGAFILGPEVEAFEASLAEACGTPHAIGVSSGTDALLMALMAAGIGPGDEVLVPAFTFFATAGVVHRLGAHPRFVDIDPDTFNLDPAAAEAAVTERTRAVIPVHLFGQPAAMDRIMALAERHGLWVIEDAAQAIGAEIHGRPAGAIGHMGALSFYPTKNLGAFGDAGAVLTSDPAPADRLRQLRLHGQSDAYRHETVGGNFRIDAIQAAVLSLKLPRLGDYTEGRRAAADRYDRLLADLPIRGPVRAAGCHHVFNQYTVRAERRDELAEHLRRQGIGCRVYYPLPLHLQPCFAELGYKRGDLPEAERAAAEVLSLPMYPELGEAAQEAVASALAGFDRVE
jgi:dTDP-4-amino-4,6-dideoxygalactose transaminase